MECTPEVIWALRLFADYALIDHTKGAYLLLLTSVFTFNAFLVQPYNLGIEGVSGQEEEVTGGRCGG